MTIKELCKKKTITIKEFNEFNCKTLLEKQVVDKGVFKLAIFHFNKALNFIGGSYWASAVISE